MARKQKDDGGKSKVTWSAAFIDRVVSVSNLYTREIPAEKRQEGYGRAARLIVTGDAGCIRDLWFCERGIEAKPSDVPIKNEVVLSADTLLDMITPGQIEINGEWREFDTDALLLLLETVSREKAVHHLRPRVTFGAAYWHGDIRMTGDHSDIDSEEWQQTLDRFLTRMAFPYSIDVWVDNAGKSKE